MYPELFELPFLHVTVKSYGVMLVLGFLVALLIMRRLARKIRLDPEELTNTALYALISGVLGSRIMYVIHNWDQFEGDLWRVFAVWEGGLELVGGVILAIIVIVTYQLIKKQPVFVFMDILAIGLMMGLCFGRIGCFLNGCCFGRPTTLPWAVRFPYESHPYESQIRPDLSRNRTQPHLELPAEYFGYPSEDGSWTDVTEAGKYHAYLKPFDKLTPEEQEAVTHGEYRCVPVHPTQIYSAMNALAICGLLALFWLKWGRDRPGTTFCLMFVLYGPMRFWIEFIREGNPYEDHWWTLTDHWTISQNAGLYLAMLGILGMVYFGLKKPQTMSEDR